MLGGRPGDGVGVDDINGGGQICCICSGGGGVSGGRTGGIMEGGRICSDGSGVSGGGHFCGDSGAFIDGGRVRCGMGGGCLCRDGSDFFGGGLRLDGGIIGLRLDVGGGGGCVGLSACLGFSTAAHTKKFLMSQLCRYIGEAQLTAYNFFKHNPIHCDPHQVDIEEYMRASKVCPHWEHRIARVQMGSKMPLTTCRVGSPRAYKIRDRIASCGSGARTA